MNKKSPSYESELILGCDDGVDEVKQYYLIETFKQEQIVGQIQEEKIGSSVIPVEATRYSVE